MPSALPLTPARKIAIAFGVAVVLLLCLIAFLLGTVATKGDLIATTVELADGRHISCIASEAGGLDCDWPLNNAQ